MKLLHHAILVLGEGCNTLLIYEETAQPMDNKKEPQIAQPVDNKKEPQIA